MTSDGPMTRWPDDPIKWAFSRTPKVKYPKVMKRRALNRRQQVTRRKANNEGRTTNDEKARGEGLPSPFAGLA